MSDLVFLIQQLQDRATQQETPDKVKLECLQLLLNLAHQEADKDLIAETQHLLKTTILNIKDHEVFLEAAHELVSEIYNTHEG